MFKKIKIAQSIKIVIASVLMLTLISFANRKHQNEICQSIIVKLDNQYDNFFVDENDIRALMADDETASLIGLPYSEIKLKDIEYRIKSQPFIEEVQTYKDLKGNLLVAANLRRPFTRIVEPGVASGYVASDGTILPTSSKYTSRVMVMSGAYMKELVKHDLPDTEEGMKIFELLTFICEDEFWRAQIAQVDISKDLYVTLYPQVTKQVIEFGAPDNIEEKFKKLKVFYQQILPQKGWNTYSRINLEYKDQVIAE